MTSHSVARLAGVSRATVSLVLNNAPHARISEETRRRVMEAATQLNYRPHAGARQLVSGRSDAIAFVLRQTPDQVFADAFLPEVLRGLTRALTTANLHLLYFPLPPTSPSADCLKLLRERRADGLILSGPRFEDLEWVERWMEEAPAVLLGHLPNSHALSVDVDNVRAAAMATRHLINLGHRRIGLITNAPLTYTASHDRWVGYRQALEEAGLPYDETLVVFGDFTSAIEEAAITQLLNRSERPTALFVASDVVAFGAIRTIRERGLHIPEDIAVVGFDDVPLAAYTEPPLTTVRVPAEALGYQAGRLLARWLKEGKKPVNTKVRLATELVVRRSCGSGSATRKGVITGREQEFPSPLVPLYPERRKGS